MSRPRIHFRTVSNEGGDVFTRSRSTNKSFDFSNIHIPDDPEAAKQLVMSKLVDQLSWDNEVNLEDVARQLTDLDIFCNTFFLEELSEKNDFGSEWKVKLMMCEIIHTPHENLIRKIVSPLLSSSNHYEFGWFHTSLLIGPFYLEWAKRGISYPKKIASKNAIVAFDIGKVKCGQELVQGIAKTVHRWNTTKLYNNKQNNCQHFVEDLLETIGIDIQSKFEGPLGYYMNLLKMGKTHSMEFIIPKEYVDHFKISNILFKTHSELDVFVSKLIALDKDFESKYPSYYSLLKAFDRAFWLRFYAIKGSKLQNDLKLVSPSEEIGCYFEDPCTTRSFSKQ